MAATNFVLVDPAAGAAQDAQDSSITEVGGSILVATNKVTIAVATGNTAVAGTLGVAGDVAVATNKATIAAATGNTTLAGTLAVTGDVAVNTDKFTVAATSGSVIMAGSCLVSGAITMNSATFLAVTPVAAATYSLALTDNFLHVAYTVTGTVDVTIPTAQAVAGRTITITDTGGNASVNNITVLTEGAELINGEADLVINVDYGTTYLQSNGTNWFVVG